MTHLSAVSTRHISPLHLLSPTPVDGREIGNVLPNNQRQRRTCYILCHIQYPVSAAHTSTFRMGLNPTSSRLMVQKATRLAFWSGGVRWVLGACECSAGNLVACELMCGMDWGLRHAFWSEATAHHQVVCGDVYRPTTRFSGSYPMIVQ